MSDYGQQPPLPQQPYGRPPGYGQPGQQPYGQPPPQPYGPPAPQVYGQPGPQPPPNYPPPSGPQSGSAQQTQPGPGTATAARPIVLTVDAVPGREVAGVIGEVMGLVARTRELPPQFRFANPVAGYESWLMATRHEAVTRMLLRAQEAGADAVVGLRYDCSEITQSLSEVVAYGTAVRLAEVAETAETGEGGDAERQAAPTPEESLDETLADLASDEGMPARSSLSG